MAAAIISPLLIEGAPLHLDSRQRLVWILARPLPGMPRFVSLAAGNFPILHWAVLISPKGYGLQKMEPLFEALRSWFPNSQHCALGTIQEIRFDQTTGQTLRRFGPITTLEFLQEFQTSSIAYVGVSGFTEEEIDGFAQRIWMTRSWDYRVLKSNCQHFASLLMQVITGQEIYPKTISDVIRNFIPFSSQPAPLLKSASMSTRAQRNPFIRWWTSLGSNSVKPEREASTMNSLIGIPVGLPPGRLQLDGFYSRLHDGERAYLDSCELGDPIMFQDYFLIVEDQISNRLSRAVCVLYNNVFLLCRYHNTGYLRVWNWTRENDHSDSSSESEQLFIYGYLYPRHIIDVTQTRVGFRLDCRGVWLGEDSVTEWLSLDFQASNAIPGDFITDLWIHSLQTFTNRNIQEIGTIFDRLPLDKGYVAEIDLHIDLKVYRTVVKHPLGSINASGLHDLVRLKIQHWGQRSTDDTWTLKYKNRKGILRPVSPDFPHDTDCGWREFFAGVFYIDF